MFSLVSCSYAIFVAPNGKKVFVKIFDIQRAEKVGSEKASDKLAPSLIALFFLDVFPSSFVFAVARADLLHGIVAAASRATL